MASQTAAKPGLHERAMHELKEFALITAYLYVPLFAIIMLKTAILKDQGVDFAPMGVAIVKAAVLAKFMMLGQMLHIGESFSARPLIWPTLSKALALTLLLIVMTVLEEIVVGWFHHRSMADLLQEMFGPRLLETLAGWVIMLLVLIPYCAFRVLNEALGKGKLARMFLVEHRAAERI